MGYLKNYPKTKKTLQVLSFIGLLIASIVVEIIAYATISAVLAAYRSEPDNVHSTVQPTTTSTIRSTTLPTRTFPSTTVTRPNTTSASTSRLSSTSTYTLLPVTSSTTPSPAPRISTELSNAINRTAYHNDTDYYTQSPSNVLRAVQGLVNNASQSEKISFPNIAAFASYSLDFAKIPVNFSLPVNATTNATRSIIEIADALLGADQDNQLEMPITPEAEHEADQTAAAIYQTLEILYDKLPPSDVPYEFKDTHILSYAHVVSVNNETRFEDLQLRTELGIQDASQGLLTPGKNNDSVASIKLCRDALKKSFEEIKQMSNGSASRFTFALSAMPAFTFSKHPSTNKRLERSSPLVLLASVGHPLKGEKIVTIRHNVDKLFDYPHGARRRHTCSYLNYATKQWSTDGCQAHKLPLWNGTMVECHCNHLTPFSLLLTMCSSVLDQSESSNSSFTLDLAIVTTATTMVAALCSLVALVIILLRIWYKNITFDEDTFARTNLWIVLFGMYFFVIFSQAMVFSPELCGQRFCLANAILVHWFSLMSMAWTGVETFRLIQMTRYPEIYARRIAIPDDTYEGFRLKAWIAATFIPMLFPIIASVSHIPGISHDWFQGYGYASHEKWCWLDGDHPWISLVTFIIPVSVMAILNVAAVIFYFYETKIRQKYIEGSRRLSPASSSSSNNSLAQEQLNGVIITTTLMGLIWLSVWLSLFACFMDPIVQHVFVLLLTLACGSQAIYIIVFQAIAPKKRFSGSRRIYAQQSPYSSEAYTEITNITRSTNSRLRTTGR
ncbi:adhesion G protein-coupled receptor E5-like [Paramacrobiotus metropolitanus]|uniref:adhesion G protein-coupled receptor E5-like n=1 Tax=Paramacrobiotus metropolitanus TaxID=2943436 RepID=UPI0024456D84|nr:adhesion G protein-coupled receptor E5-like [Paramacrobiotus metropolitanus]